MFWSSEQHLWIGGGGGGGGGGGWNKKNGWLRHTTSRMWKSRVQSLAGADGKTFWFLFGPSFLSPSTSNLVSSVRLELSFFFFKKVVTESALSANAMFAGKRAIEYLPFPRMFMVYQTARKTARTHGARSLSGKAENQRYAKLSWKSPLVEEQVIQFAAVRTKRGEERGEKKSFHAALNGASLFRRRLYERKQRKHKGCVLIHFRRCHSLLSLRALMSARQSRLAGTCLIL